MAELQAANGLEPIEEAQEGETHAKPRPERLRLAVITTAAAQCFDETATPWLLPIHLLS